MILPIAAKSTPKEPLLEEVIPPVDDWTEWGGDLTRELVVWVRDYSWLALTAAAVSIGVYLLLVLIRSRACKRLSQQRFGSWGWVMLKVATATRDFFLLAAAAKVVTSGFHTPQQLNDIINFLFTVAAAVQGALWIRELLLSLVERRTATNDPDGAISSAVGVLSILINMVVWTIAAIILLDNLGVNVTGLIAGLGIGGIAIGLAAQGIVADLFAALSILFDRPFRRGETIQVGGSSGIVGTVENIGLKTTRLRALSGEMVVLSNANILNQQINNFADYTRRRAVMMIGVTYQTSADLLARIPAEIQKIIESRSLCTFDRAHLIRFGTSSLDYEVVFIVNDTALSVMMDEQQVVLIEIVRVFAELGIELALPSQVSYLAGPDGKIVAPEQTAMAAAGPLLSAGNQGAGHGA